MVHPSYSPMAIVFQAGFLSREIAPQVVRTSRFLYGAETIFCACYIRSAVQSGCLLPKPLLVLCSIARNPESPALLLVLAAFLFTTSLIIFVLD